MINNVRTRRRKRLVRKTWRIIVLVAVTGDFAINAIQVHIAGGVGKITEMMQETISLKALIVGVLLLCLLCSACRVEAPKGKKVVGAWWVLVSMFGAIYMAYMFWGCAVSFITAIAMGVMGAATIFFGLVGMARLTTDYDKEFFEIIKDMIKSQQKYLAIGRFILIVTIVILNMCWMLFFTIRAL